MCLPEHLRQTGSRRNRKTSLTNKFPLSCGSFSTIALSLGGHHGPFGRSDISALDLRLQSVVVKRTAVKSEASGWWQEALACRKRRDYGPPTRRSRVRGEGREDGNGKK